MTRRKKTLLAMAIAVAAFVLVGVAVLTGRVSPPERGARPLRASEASTGTTRGREATPGVSSNEPTLSLPMTAAPESPGDDAHTLALSPVLTPESLDRVEGVPERTLAFAKPTAASAGDAYVVMFAPYGYGPGGKRRSLIVRISRSTPIGSLRAPLPLAGRNVLLDVSGIAAQKTIEVGGSYSGTIEFVLKDGALVPRLRDLR